MATLDDATKPVDTSSMTLADSSKTSGPTPDAEQTPGLNPFLRCPMPQISAYPDSLRQYFHNGVPQTRVIPVTPSNVTNVGPQGPTGATGAQGASVIASPTIKSVAGQLKREVIPVTTDVLASNASESGTVPLGKTFSLMEIEAVSGPCRVRLYSSAAYRTTDLASGRDSNTPPVAFSEHGLIFDATIDDVITSTLTGYTPVSIGGGSISGWPTESIMGPVGQVAAGDVIRFGGDGLTEMQIPGGAPGAGDGIMTFWWEPIHAAIWSTGPVKVLTSPWFQAPFGATYLGCSNTVNDTEFNGSMYKATTFAYVISSPYPISWGCSPEAPGSDLSDFPVGNIAYVIENLGTGSTAVTVNFTILREEK